MLGGCQKKMVGCGRDGWGVPEVQWCREEEDPRMEERNAKDYDVGGAVKPHKIKCTVDVDQTYLQRIEKGIKDVARR